MKHVILITILLFSAFMESGILLADDAADVMDLDRNSRIKGGKKNTDRAVSNDRTVDNLIPSRKNGIPTWKVMMYDFLPGGGHFYRGDYYTGGAFCLLKIIGAYSIFYYYNDWKYRKSLYLAARKANNAIDSSHVLKFRDDEGEYKTVKNFRHDYDSAIQLMTLSITANIFIYAVSWMINYNRIVDFNERTIPTFDVYTYDNASSRENVFIIKYNFRM